MPSEYPPSAENSYYVTRHILEGPKFQILEIQNIAIVYLLLLIYRYIQSVLQALWDGISSWCQHTEFLIDLMPYIITGSVTGDREWCGEL